MNKQVRGRNLFSLFEPFLIVVFWILLFASPFMLGNYEYGFNWNHIFRVWISFVPYLIVFLINRFVLLPYLFFRNQRLLFIAGASLMIILMTFGVHINRGELFPKGNKVQQNMPRNQFPESTRARPNDMHRNPMPPKPPLNLPPFISFFVISILIVGFDTGLILSVKWVQSERKRASEEKEHMQTQLAFLRNQVSPHFFMNTLNNIHSLIDFDTVEAKESIIRLSKLMRHLLYDSEAEKIPIQKEMDFISNYVDLMRLRYSDELKIRLDIPHNLPDKSIPPLLFTSFVENAFKHGISHKKSMFIDISFSYADDSLHFQIRNSHTGSKSEDEHSGIGIANSRKRLDLIYGVQYSLNIEDKEDEFNVNLIIPV